MKLRLLRSLYTIFTKISQNPQKRLIHKSKIVAIMNADKGLIRQYGSIKTDIPGTPLPKGGTRKLLKSPLLSGDLGGSPGRK
ncbi:hypothetical protein C7B67_23320 [filamentous cyanobacterium Phorm 6]|nr:hypothetical protein C7B67_23320 [filamentous cyanobacterium Phorm 6]